MNGDTFFHALGLQMHQPAGNLRRLIDENPWEAEQIIRCYQRPLRFVQYYGDVARLHVGFSGVLLEQLRSPDIIDRYRHLVDLPQLLADYRDNPNIELLGTGYFHPIFPAIPPADWNEQLTAGRDMMTATFGRQPRGFFPPEMAFSMDMIPALVQAGYDYVVVDDTYVHPQDGVIDPFRPYRACHDGYCVSIVPCDRALSDAQQSGLDPTWLEHEVRERVAASPRPHEPRLISTWCAGENGGWFRQLHEHAGFFGFYFAPYMERVRSSHYPLRPVLLSEYLGWQRPSCSARVRASAWDLSHQARFEFSNWDVTPHQQQIAVIINGLSQRYWGLIGRGAAQLPDLTSELMTARRLVLETQTSCYLCWDNAWLSHLEQLIQQAAALLDQLEQRLSV
ncbi:polysaccharide deacetylase family protein [Rhodoferax sp. 4810]|uniref:Polysaccharide deacetylase family protein n=1 Tax=Thiospirillum jenense TaxID=1653858 RepID=A0A839HFY1_9GAMM|nr:polysaccharide deacetylase family protein [Thiospirillum jenense]MBB1073539.1 polysaccharide deacetylase family protein [Rhodoferax jenense]MBB1126027.1 polysaccharide deacetylase family protein [Thiospirillum jenense]